MLQDVVDEYLTALSVEAQEGAAFKATNQNIVMAYRNDLGQARSYLGWQRGS